MNRTVSVERSIEDFHIAETKRTRVVFVEELDPTNWL